MSEQLSSRYWEKNDNSKALIVVSPARRCHCHLMSGDDDKSDEDNLDGQGWVQVLPAVDIHEEGFEALHSVMSPWKKKPALYQPLQPKRAGVARPYV
ncbi:hypothetical protein J6590_061956 [Homalodisca vitripennis]|nr:hypothetical protein J6590_061956 [Homalodisca vitripennis]